MPYQSGKTYTHEQGLSCCFRQHNAKSHCRFLHGYALQVEFEWEATTLDANNWVVDFGALTPIKEFLEKNFDHKLVVAKDDPKLPAIRMMVKHELAEMILLPAVGCEAFAKFIFDYVDTWTKDAYKNRVKLIRTTVREHGGNHATYSLK